jgi:hypothetical protein
MSLAVSSTPVSGATTLTLGPAATQTLNPNVIVATPGSNGFAGLTNSSTAAPAAKTTTTNNTSGGGTSGDSSAASTAAALATKVNSAISGTDAGAISAGQGAASSAGADIASTADNDLQGLSTQQNAINLAREQAGTTDITTIRQLQNTIKDGLQGTGVQLGNTGALDSSAAQAAARAYANYGNVQTNAANNTEAQANIAQNVQQTDLTGDINYDMDSLSRQKDAAVGQIQANAASAMDSLAVLVTAYLGGNYDSSNTSKIVNQIVSSAQDQLNAVDSQYQSQLQGITPESESAVATNAQSAANAGTVDSASAPYATIPSTATSQAPSTLTSSAAPNPSLIPLTLGPVSSSNQNNLIPTGT